jgi:phage tail-like protein
MPEPTQPPPKKAAVAGFKDPYGTFNFKVLIEGLAEAAAGFTACSPIGAETKAIEYRQGGEHQVVHRLPTQVRYRDVTLEYGLTDSKEMWHWIDAAMKGTPKRRNVSIVVLAPDGSTEAVRFNLSKAWPSSWVGAPLNALSNETYIQKMTIVYETLELA